MTPVGVPLYGVPRREPFLEWHHKRYAKWQKADRHDQNYTGDQQSLSGAGPAGDQQVRKAQS